MRNSVRFIILKRDGFACQYCGRKGNKIELEVDHIIPRSNGGKDTSTNLITACFECNRGKDVKSVDIPKPKYVRLPENNDERVSFYNKTIGITPDDLEYIRGLRQGTKKSLAGTLSEIINENRGNQKTKGDRKRKG